MFEELLIEAVRNRPLLYSKESKDYSKSTKRKAAWAEIAMMLNTTTHKCEKRWKSLRDQFSKEHRRRNTPVPSGGPAAAVPTKEWELYNSMLFLLDHIKHRKTISSSSLMSSTCSVNENTILSNFIGLREIGAIDCSNMQVVYDAGRNDSTTTTDTTTTSEISTAHNTSTADQTITNDNIIYAAHTITTDNRENDETASQSSSLTGGRDTQWTSTSSSVETDFSSSRKRSLMSPLADSRAYRRRKQTDNTVDRLLTESSASVATALTQLTSFLATDQSTTNGNDHDKKNTGTVQTDLDDDLTDLVDGVKRHLWHVPDSSRTDCLVEIYQVISKYESVPCKCASNKT